MWILQKNLYFYWNKENKEINIHKNHNIICLNDSIPSLKDIINLRNKINDRDKNINN